MIPLIPFFAAWFLLIPSKQDSFVKHLNLITLQLHGRESKKDFFNLIALDINVVLDNFIYIYEYGEECNFVIAFLLAVTQSSAISAPIVKSKPFRELITVCGCLRTLWKRSKNRSSVQSTMCSNEWIWPLGALLCYLVSFLPFWTLSFL